MATKKRRASVDEPERKARRRAPPRTHRDVALHEAAHAVAAAILGLPLEVVTIDPAQDNLGALVCGCVLDGAPVAKGDAKSTLDAKGVVLIAGPVADVLWSGKQPEIEKSSGWKADLEAIKVLLDQLGTHAGRKLTSGQRGAAFEGWWARADEMLTTRQELVALVANELLQRRTVAGKWVIERARQALEAAQ